MFRQIPCPNWCIITLVTFKQFLSSVGFHLCQNWCIVTLIAFIPFFSRVYYRTYVSLKDLNVQMQVHIGHICLACPVLFCHITVRSFGGGSCHYSDKLLIEESWSSSWRVKLSLSHHSRRLIVIYWECVIVAFSTVIREVIKNIARIANAVPVTLY